MRRGNIFFGLFLIFIGGLALMGTILDYDFISWRNMWPLFILIPGLAFEMGYFLSGRASGLLVPGGILTTIGTLFLVENFIGWHTMRYLWPVFPLSIAVGLFQLYLAIGRPWGLLIPVGILGGFSGISFLTILLNAAMTSKLIGYVFAAMLIVLGVFLLFKSSGKPER